MRSYYDVYGCQKCPVSRYCGTMVGCMRLCHSYTEDTIPYGKQIMPVSMLEQISFANVVINKQSKHHE